MSLYAYDVILFCKIIRKMLPKAHMATVYAKPKGRPLVDAALAGARLRLRPILMTSLAFVFGCVPLWFASGAGSVARRIMGTTVIGGMLAASAIGIFFIPAIFYVVETLSGAKRKESVPAAAPVPAEIG